MCDFIHFNYETVHSGANIQIKPAKQNSSIIWYWVDWVSGSAVIELLVMATAFICLLFLLSQWYTSRRGGGLVFLHPGQILIYVTWLICMAAAILGLKHVLKYSAAQPPTDLLCWGSFGSLDPLAPLFILLTVIIMHVCAIISKSIRHDFWLYGACLLAIEALLLLAFSTNNLLVFYLSFEAVLLPMYFIIGRWGSRSERSYASYLFFLYTLIGSVFFLYSLIVIFITVETFELSEIIKLAGESGLSGDTRCWLGLAIGFAFKIPVFPVHSWLTVAHVEAPTAGSVILASLLLKLGGFGLLKFANTICPLAFLIEHERGAALCTLGIIFATASAIRQLDLKRFIAYTSIAHMHVFITALLTATHAGTWGAVHGMLSHGFIAAGLFILVGALYDRFGVRLIRYYSGVVITLPMFSVFWALFLFANAGMPFLSGFPAELITIIETVDCLPMFGLSLIPGLLGAVVYAFLMLTRVLFGAAPVWSRETGAAVDLVRHEHWALSYLFFWVIYLGMNPRVVSKTLWPTININSIHDPYTCYS